MNTRLAISAISALNSDCQDLLPVTGIAQGNEEDALLILGQTELIRVAVEWWSKVTRVREH